MGQDNRWPAWTAMHHQYRSPGLLLMLLLSTMMFAVMKLAPEIHAACCSSKLLTITHAQPLFYIGNESVPIIIINDAINLFFNCITAVCILLISNNNSFRLQFDNKIASVLFYLKKYISTAALKMTSPGNRHCANCIGTLSSPIVEL